MYAKESVAFTKWGTFWCHSVSDCGEKGNLKMVFGN